MRALGLMNPTPVQQTGIPVILGGSNAAIQSYTGSGKVCPPSPPVPFNPHLRMNLTNTGHTHMSEQTADNVALAIAPQHWLLLADAGISAAGAQLGHPARGAGVHATDQPAAPA